jgi:hypothetical protein
MSGAETALGGGAHWGGLSAPLDGGGDVAAGVIAPCYMTEA